MNVVPDKAISKSMLDLVRVWDGLTSSIIETNVKKVALYNWNFQGFGRSAQWCSGERSVIMPGVPVSILGSDRKFSLFFLLVKKNQ